MSVGGIHFWINPHYYSHKYNIAGFEHKLGISLVSNEPLWTQRPYPAGQNYVRIFKEQSLLADLQQRSQKVIKEKYEKKMKARRARTIPKAQINLQDYTSTTNQIIDDDDVLECELMRDFLITFQYFT